MQEIKILFLFFEVDNVTVLQIQNRLFSPF